MNAPETKRLSETVSSAASMTLFLLFAVCCLIIIAVAASAYGRINENYESSFNSAAAVRYVTNKLRACDKAEIISENELLLINDGYSTVIYCKDGTVYERVFGKEQTPVSEGGEEMFRAGTLTVTEKDGLISVSASEASNEKNSFTAYCRKNEGGGGDAQSD